MEAYLDITLLISDDIDHHFLWGKVYQQLHLALVENKNADGTVDFGVTFPQFNTEKQQLGRKLRVFGPNQNSLETLNLTHWMNRLLDYVHITSIRQTPEPKCYIRFTRLRTKSSRERLARRAARRKGIGYEQALKERSGFQPKFITNAAYIQLKSLGNGHPFRLFIACEQMEQPIEAVNEFSSYGLSKGQSLPMF